jgi:Tfp pilus assembly protein PilO
MNAIPMNPAARKGSRGPRALLQPPEEWSRHRTVSVALVLALLAFVLGARAWRISDASQLEASRVAWTAAQARSQEAGRIAAGLPDLRSRAASGQLKPEQWGAADAWRAIADLAAQSGLRETSIEPATRKAVDPKASSPIPERALRLRAEGTFEEIRRFLEGIAGLPRLVVPESVQIRRQTGALVVDATLRVFETLPPIALATEAPRANAFIVDPFGSADAGGRGADLLLVGTLVGPRRAMALLQSGTDVDGFAPGQKIGAERLGRVVPREVELARDNGLSRKLTIAEDRK